MCFYLINQNLQILDETCRVQHQLSTNKSVMQRWQGYSFALNSEHKLHSDLNLVHLQVLQLVDRLNLQKHSDLLSLYDW